ncbi:MAG: GFA family protein [Caulobacteraceae bacterium]|nr:GFA family protein [Caulobacteraceae bacterium]
MIDASCHCGAVRLEIARAPDTVTDCNCSICRRLGTLWAYFRPDEVTVIAARDATAPYIWGDRVLAFHHCRLCGCTTHWRNLDPKGDRMGINARLLDPRGLEKARVRKLEGAAA